MVSGESGSRSWGARVLAPVAFFAAATILVLLIHSSLTAETESASAPTATRSNGAEATGTRAGSETTSGASGRQQRRFYRIRTGDTLEAIALRFDTTVDDLLTLNPGIEANSLAPGQRIRVR
jgi:LysM repeat protein